MSTIMKFFINKWINSKKLLSSHTNLFTLITYEHYFEKYILLIRPMKLIRVNGGRRFVKSSFKERCCASTVLGVMYIMLAFVQFMYPHYQNKFIDYFVLSSEIFLFFMAWGLIVTRYYRHYDYISILKQVENTDLILNKELDKNYDYIFFKYLLLSSFMSIWIVTIPYHLINVYYYGYSSPRTLLHQASYLLPMYQLYTELFFLILFLGSRYSKLKIIKKQILDCNKNPPKVVINKLNKLMHITHLIRSSIKNAEKLFSLAYLFSMVSSFITTLIAAAAWNICPSNLAIEFVISVASNLVLCFIVGNMAEMLKDAYDSIPEAISELEFHSVNIVKLKHTFILQISNNPLQVMACGLFKINRNLFLIFFGNLVTSISYLYNLFPDLQPK